MRSGDTAPAGTPVVDDNAVRQAVATVPDPELPPVTIGMLGMVHDVRVDGGTVTVELLPTFAGCPATDMIARDVAAAVDALSGVQAVKVRFRFDPPWTPARITEAGHEALRSFGIAPPTGADPVHTAERRTLPLAVEDRRGCPYCGSTDTARESLFGPTPCRAIHYCNRCQQPFEAFKS